MVVPIADYEGPLPGQAACWLDIKRTYLELRPRRRWVYTCYCDAGLSPLPSNDWDSGWLGNLLAQEVGPATHISSIWEWINWAIQSA